MELEKEHAPVSVTLVHPGRVDTPYNEHAMSYMDKQPGHRGMIYPPEAVAEAILYAAENPKRDLFVGSQAKIFAILGRALPRFTDKLVEKVMYPTQHLDRPSNPPEKKVALPSEFLPLFFFMLLTVIFPAKTASGYISMYPCLKSGTL